MIDSDGSVDAQAWNACTRTDHSNAQRILIKSIGTSDRAWLMGDRSIPIALYTPLPLIPPLLLFLLHHKFKKKIKNKVGKIYVYKYYI